MEVQLKSAREMFEKYGEELIQDNENWLIYSKKPNKWRKKT